MGRRRVVVLVVTFILAWPLVSTRINAHSQHKVDSWGRYTWQGEEFTVLTPGTPSAYIDTITNRSGLMTLERIYSSYVKGVIYLVSLMIAAR
jgi:hypothetical protein